jgi:hypothetical protein
MNKREKINIKTYNNGKEMNKKRSRPKKKKKIQ